MCKLNSFQGERSLKKKIQLKLNSWSSPGLQTHLELPTSLRPRTLLRTRWPCPGTSPTKTVEVPLQDTGWRDTSRTTTSGSDATNCPSRTQTTGFSSSSCLRSHFLLLWLHVIYVSSAGSKGFLLERSTSSESWLRTWQELGSPARRQIPSSWRIQLVCADVDQSIYINQ